MRKRCRRNPRPVLLPIGMKRLTELELVPRICVESIGHPWMHLDHIYQIGATALLAMEIATMRKDMTARDSARSVLDAVRQLEDLHSRVALSALTDEDREAMQRKVCRMIDWISQRSNVDIDRASRKLVSDHDCLSRS